MGLVLAGLVSVEFVWSSATMASAQTSEYVDDFVSNPARSVDGVETNGHFWTKRSGSFSFSRTTGGAKRNGGQNGGWTMVSTDMPTGQGEVTITSSFPQDSQWDLHGTAVAVVFRGGSGGYLALSALCGSGGNRVEWIRWKDNTMTYFGASTAVPGLTCNATHQIKVAFDGSDYVGSVDGAAVITYNDVGFALGIPETQAGVGFGMYSGPNRRGENTRVTAIVARSGPPVDVQPPYYRCGRTIRDVGGGTYFVDLEAANLEAAITGGVGAEFYEDSGHRWQLSWGPTAGASAAGTSESKATFALPPLSQMPPGGWAATFRVIRKTGNQITPNNGKEIGSQYFGGGDFGGGDFRQLDEDGDGPEPTKWWWVNTEAWEKFSSFLSSAENVYGQLFEHNYLPEQAIRVDKPVTGSAPMTGGDWDTWLQGNGPDLQEAEGVCTVMINPLEPQFQPDSTTGPPTVNICPAQTGTTTTTIAACSTTTTTAPGSSTTTTKPDGGVDGQGEDGTSSDCSAGFFGRLPIIGGAFELVARLICALKQLLVDLFVPDDWGELVSVGEFASKFPASWVASGVGGVSALRSTVQTGIGGSACGPVINAPAPLSMTVRFPGPGGCGGSGNATADAGAYDLFGYRAGFRALLTGMLYLSVVWRLIRLAPWSEGKDDGGPV